MNKKLLVTLFVFAVLAVSISACKKIEAWPRLELWMSPSKHLREFSYKFWSTKNTSNMFFERIKFVVNTGKCKFSKEHFLIIRIV